jgi:CheY-like chemotaxis protein
MYVLIADDDSGIRAMLAETLEDEGYQVVTAANGRDALAYLRRGPLPQLILLDLMMPLMTGWDVLHELTRHPILGQIPVVILSATDAAEQTAMTYHVAACLPKPVEFDSLLQVVERYCQPKPA